MRAISPLLLLFFLASFTFDKEKVYPFEKWTKEELEKANTAKNVSYLTQEEKQVIYYTNLARINPKLFAETYAQQYIDTSGKKSSYTLSLIASLKKQVPLVALRPDSMLSKTAAEHATATGKTGATGHSGNNRRYNEVKKTFPRWGENCSYGYSDGLGIVMQLLIDEDHADLGHRKTILSEKYTHIGTAIRPHRKYNWNCVQDFGG
jgi:uncharacterized protein YkwD